MNRFVYSGGLVFEFVHANCCSFVYHIILPIYVKGIFESEQQLAECFLLILVIIEEACICIGRIIVS